MNQPPPHKQSSYNAVFFEACSQKKISNEKMSHHHLASTERNYFIKGEQLHTGNWNELKPFVGLMALAKLKRQQKASTNLQVYLRQQVN